MPLALPSLKNRAKRVAIPADPRNSGSLPPLEVRRRIAYAVRDAVLERFPTSPYTSCLFFGMVGARLASEVTGTHYRFQAGLATQLDDGTGHSYTANHCWSAAGHPGGRVEFLDLSALAWPEPRFVWDWTPQVFEPLSNYKVERIPTLTTLTEAELQAGKVKSWYRGKLQAGALASGLPAILFDQVHDRAAEFCGLPLSNPWEPWSLDMRKVGILERKLGELLAKLKEVA